MKLNPVITLNAVFALAFGILFTLYGPVMMAFFGVAEISGDNVLLYWHAASFARLFGAALFGFGMLLWALRSLLLRNAALQGKRGVLFSLLFTNGVAAIVAITQQFSIWERPVGWGLVGLFGLFALAYAVLLALNHEA
jgi:hypothetical protein